MRAGHTCGRVPSKKWNTNMFNRLTKSIRTNIVVGLILVTPIVITLWVINAIFNFFNESKTFQKSLNGLPINVRQSIPDFLWSVIAFLIVLAGLFCIGLLVRNFLGRQIYRLGDKVIGKIPVVNKIYLFVRNISEAVVAQRDTMFQEVVLIQYPRDGLWAFAFVTSKVPKDLSSLLDDQDDYTYVFVPTTPNPTSGVLVAAHRSEMRTLDMTPSDAMKIIVSAGAASPEQMGGDEHPTLLDKVEHWLESRGKPSTLLPPAADD
ncbi:MAG: putative membrane protein [Kiritimatiellia bacterium]|jgi:uncharacterized membrane protein